jgi:hypothetical protein
MSHEDEQRGYRGDNGPQNADYWAGYNRRLDDIATENNRFFDNQFSNLGSGRSSAVADEVAGPPKTIAEMATAGAWMFGALFLVYAHFVYGAPGVTLWQLIGQGLIAFLAGVSAGAAWWVAIRLLKIVLVVAAWGLLLAFVYYAFR